MRSLATNEVKVKVAHHSLQFSDTEAQQRHDVKRIFQRAVGRGTWWLTGTEAGRGAGNKLEYILREEANKYGFMFFSPKGSDCWIAVDRSVIAGEWSTYWKLIIPGRAKQYTGKGITAVTFRSYDLGMITIVAGHYLTKKADPGWHQNRKLGRAIAKYMRKKAKGGDKSFYGGDQNMVDRVYDTFFGGKIRSCWDEIKKWPNTGHGNIDVIARTLKDKAVRCLGARVLRDKAFFLYTDHFTVEAEYAVKKLPKKKRVDRSFLMDEGT